MTTTTCSRCPWTYPGGQHGPIAALLEHWRTTHAPAVAVVVMPALAAAP